MIHLRSVTSATVLLFAIGAAEPVRAEVLKPGVGFDVERYDLALAPDPAAKSVIGNETIVLRATGDDVRQLAFSGNALTIDAVSVNGVSSTVSQIGKTLFIDLPSPLARGQKASLSLSYHGVPARGIAGSASGLYSSYFACDWMICLQDAPGDKALFSLDLLVPKGMDSLSIGRRVSVRSEPAGSQVHRWRTSRPYSAYLFGFALGHFNRAVERVDGAELIYLGAGTDTAELKRRFATTPEMVRFLSAKAGLTLPGGRYTQLLVAGDEAQESATYSVIGTDELPAAADPTDDWVIVHELAHQYWGNLVTCATWQDFWLNEGITTFMTAAWKEHRYGRAAYDAELEAARGRLGRARDKGFDKPLAWAGDYPSLGTRRAVQYSKGALFLDHLRTVMGDDAFWKGLRSFTRRHAGGTVTSDDFERAMTQADGRNLRDEFREWVGN